MSTESFLEDDEKEAVETSKQSTSSDWTDTDSIALFIFGVTLIVLIVAAIACFIIQRRRTNQPHEKDEERTVHSAAKKMLAENNKGGKEEVKGLPFKPQKGPLKLVEPSAAVTSLQRDGTENQEDKEVSKETIKEGSKEGNSEAKDNLNSESLTEGKSGDSKTVASE